MNPPLQTSGKSTTSPAWRRSYTNDEARIVTDSRRDHRSLPDHSVDLGRRAIVDRATGLPQRRASPDLIHKGVADLQRIHDGHAVAHDAPDARGSARAAVAALQCLLLLLRQLGVQRLEEAGRRALGVLLIGLLLLRFDQRLLPQRLRATAGVHATRGAVARRGADELSVQYRHEALTDTARSLLITLNAGSWLTDRGSDRRCAGSRSAFLRHRAHS